jgi:hypothetical protein
MGFCYGMLAQGMEFSPILRLLYDQLTPLALNTMSPGPALRYPGCSRQSPILRMIWLIIRLHDCTLKLSFYGLQKPSIPQTGSTMVVIWQPG